MTGPHWVLTHPTLSHAVVRLWSILRDYDGTHGCFPKVETLADDMGVSARQVRYHLAALEAIGAIAITPVSLKSNRYKIAGETPITASRSALANRDRQRVQGRKGAEQRRKSPCRIENDSVHNENQTAMNVQSADSSDTAIPLQGKGTGSPSGVSSSSFVVEERSDPSPREDRSAARTAAAGVSGAGPRVSVASDAQPPEPTAPASAQRSIARRPDVATHALKAETVGSRAGFGSVLVDVRFDDREEW